MTVKDLINIEGINQLQSFAEKFLLAIDNMHLPIAHYNIIKPRKDFTLLAMMFAMSAGDEFPQKERERERVESLIGRWEMNAGALTGDDLAFYKQYKEGLYQLTATVANMVAEMKMQSCDA